MSKEEFIIILERQQQSGLSIKDFCQNESYTRSSFHYWKSKFGLSRVYNNHGGGESLEPLAPVSLKQPALDRKEIKVPVTPCSSKGEITIKFPGGIHVSFKGSAQAGMALSILNQICSSHVLPE